MNDVIQLSAHELTVQFGGLVAVKALNLEVTGGRVLGLIGPNGAGKSTVINALTGYVNCASGSIRLDRDGAETELSALSTQLRSRHGIARTFQTPRLIPELTVAENVALAIVGKTLRQRWFEGFGGLALARGTLSRQTAALEALGLLGISGLGGELTTSLSLGEQRLVEIARVSLSGACVLLLDEPFAGLSPIEQERLAREIDNLRQSKIAILLVEHQLDHVRALADEVVVMDQGACLIRGSAAEVLDSPIVRERYLGEVAL